jgi:hypothetical protein
MSLPPDGPPADGGSGRCFYACKKRRVQRNQKSPGPTAPVSAFFIAALAQPSGFARASSRVRNLWASRDLVSRLPPEICDLIRATRRASRGNRGAVSTAHRLRCEETLGLDEANPESTCVFCNKCNLGHYKILSTNLFFARSSRNLQQLRSAATTFKTTASKATYGQGNYIQGNYIQGNYVQDNRKAGRHAI